MKKIISLLLFALSISLAALALAEGIAVKKNELSVNDGLPGNVTNVLVLLQDGDVTDTMMIASADGNSGRAVMTRLDCALEVNVSGAGAAPLSAVYAMGAQGSRGLLAARTVNELLGTNIETYVAIDIAMMPQLVDALDALTLTLDAREAQALGLTEGECALTGEQALSYVRLKFEDDDPALSRGYQALMQLLRQALHSGGLMSKLSLAQKLLSSMDTNVNILGMMSLLPVVQGGEDRRELALPGESGGDAQAMRDAFYREVYE